MVTTALPQESRILGIPRWVLSITSAASMTSFLTAVSMAAATVWLEFLAQPVPATRMYFPTKISLLERSRKTRVFGSSF